MRVIKAEAKRLIELAADDDELRADLRAVAEAILAATEGKAGASPPAEVEPVAAAIARSAGDAGPSRPGPVEVAQTDSGAADEPLRELTLGRSSPSQGDPAATVAELTRPAATHGDIEEIEARCRRKADAARWSAERLRRIREGNAFEVENPPADQETIAWVGRITDCFYWMNPIEGAEQADIALFDDLAGCFETVAEALLLVRGTLKERPGNPKSLERALPLLAEAQSALRAAVQRFRAPDDPDQLEVFEWLKTTAARHHVYIKRFMRVDDLASPSRWPDLVARIESLATGDQVSRRIRSQIEQLQEHQKRIGSDDGTVHCWQALIGTVDEMVAEGVPPSNREIRELLLPVIEKLPERQDLPAGFRLVLRELDRFLGTRSSPARSPVSHEPAAEVKEVARLLAGRSIVLIGGNRRREAQQSLERSLGLRDLVWIETKEHQAVDAFEPLIARADVALVLLAIRWSSHAFGDVKQFCDRHGKPLVRLPAGYSPNQVAAQIIAQCSGQL